jgi:hypothetical protein
MKKRNANRILVGKSDKKDHLQALAIDGRIT